MSVPYDDLAEGQRTAALKALRRLLANSLTYAKPHQVASVAKEFRATLDALEQVATPDVSASDDLAAARKARLRQAKDSAHPAGGALGV